MLETLAIMASEAEEVVEEEEAAFFKPFSRGLLGGAEVEVVVLEAEEEGELGWGGTTGEALLVGRVGGACVGAGLAMGRLVSKASPQLV